jgi:DNA-binding transcriptional MerR regulator
MEGERACSIAEAARVTGVSTYTLRYYEQEGLMLHSVSRSPTSRHRRYTPEAIAWINFLTKLRGTGMPVRRMREYAELVGAGEGNETERLALLEKHQATVTSQIRAMQRNLEEIEHKIDLYRAHVAETVSTSAVRHTA